MLQKLIPQFIVIWFCTDYKVGRPLTNIKHMPVFFTVLLLGFVTRWPPLDHCCLTSLSRSLEAPSRAGFFNLHLGQVCPRPPSQVVKPLVSTLNLLVCRVRINLMAKMKAMLLRPASLFPRSYASYVKQTCPSGLPGLFLIL